MKDQLDQALKVLINTNSVKIWFIPNLNFQYTHLLQICFPVHAYICEDTLLFLLCAGEFGLRAASTARGIQNR